MKKVKRKAKLFVVVLVVTGLFFGAGSLQAEEYTARDLNEQLVMAMLWMQTSAEFRAICYQTFNLAQMTLDAFLSGYSGTKPVAVIVDADETVIDNSLYEAWLIGNDFGYSSKTWTPWMAAAKATAVPGALDFLNHARDIGVEVFYVTNRKMVGYDGTEKNLKELGFPFVDKKHLLLRTDTSNKQPRRDSVTADYEVALMMGDNLNDFSGVFKKDTVGDRVAEVDKMQSMWGKKFFVLPNPTYGDWEGVIYKNNWKASVTEKDQMRKAHLNRWDYQPQ